MYNSKSRAIWEQIDKGLNGIEQESLAKMHSAKIIGGAKDD